MGELHKMRLDKEGKQIGEESQLEKNEFRGSVLDRIKNEVKDEQGCRISGYVRVYRVPGNIHVASHPYRDMVEQLKSEGTILDFEYEIHHFSMGNKKDFDYIKQQFEDLEMEHPVDGIKGKPERDEDGTTPKFMKTLFYLVAVPSYFERGLFRYHVYQLISNYEITHYIVTYFIARWKGKRAAGGMDAGVRTTA